MSQDTPSFRRQARLRHEYIYRRENEGKRNAIKARKASVKNSLENNVPIHPDLRKDALRLQKKIQWEDAGPELAVAQGTEMGGTTGDHEDDEYRWAGVEDPKIMITTSRNPSSRLKMFSKELRLLFPNTQKMNRGKHEIKSLVEYCQANDFTDLILVYEHRGVPDTLIISHLPYGPSARFSISDVTMRHDIPGIGTMSEAYPHLIFHNFKTKLGERTMNILKYLFPVPKEDSKRVMTFVNHNDSIVFRHHTYRRDGKNVELKEVGPRFQLKLYEIKLGTLENAAADVEWALRPYMNTSHKRRFLSDEDGFKRKKKET